MGPSDAEIEGRLAELRRQREAIDREIADHLLYRELARRLDHTGGVDAAPAATPAPPATASSAGEPSGASPAPFPRAFPDLTVSPAVEAPPATAPRPPADRAAAAPGGLPPAIAFAQDPAAARRYGRALVDAACAVIRSAGRPLHAGEILPHLVARGFTLPGRDPVAALNTRLWKRAAPGGPLQRLGEATYALAADRAGEAAEGIA